MSYTIKDFYSQEEYNVGYFRHILLTLFKRGTPKAIYNTEVDILCFDRIWLLSFLYIDEDTLCVKVFSQEPNNPVVYNIWTTNTDTISNDSRNDISFHLYLRGYLLEHTNEWFLKHDINLNIKLDQ